MHRFLSLAASRRSRRSLLGIVFSAVLLALFVVPAQAVHDLDVIELDANIADDADAGTDWGAVFDANGDPVVANLPAGTFDTTGVIQDFVPGANGPDPSYHQPSNKDQQAINPAGGSDVWGCTSKPNPVDKDDIVNAYALAVDVDGDLVTYFGVERYDNSGTAFVGVWLFQADVTCNLATGKFEGQKTTGDILILSDFTNGGVINHLQAYEFIAGAGPSDPGTFDLLLDGIDCDDSAAGDNLCANVNTGDVVTPWPMEDKQKPGAPSPDPINTLEISEFEEGGINLTEVFEDAGRVPPECFGSFMAETRTSDQLTGANLTDFALGDLRTCHPDVHVAKTSSVPSIGAGGSYDYTITATNDGNEAAQDVVVTDDLDDDLIVNSATFDVDPGTAGGTGDCTVGAGNTIECDIGTLAASDGNSTGAEPDTAVVTVNVTTVLANCPSVVNTSHVTASNEPEEDQADNDSLPVTVNVDCAAIRITKNSTKGGLVGAAGAEFTISPHPTGGSGTFTVVDNGANDADSDVGEVCVEPVIPGVLYTITETVAPPGYGLPADPDDTTTPTAGGTCASGAAEVTFADPPLAEFIIDFNDLGSGETSADISCTGLTPTPDDATPGVFDDDTETYTNLEPNTTGYTCTIKIDP